MKQERPPIWIILGISLLWVGLAVNVANDYIHYDRISPFSILFLIALLSGFLITKIFKWPFYSRRPSKPALMSILILILFLIVYIMIRIIL